MVAPLLAAYAVFSIVDVPAPLVEDASPSEATTEPDRSTAEPLPEPMFFDLVRPLGARRGELEANVLVHASPARGKVGAVAWAPEVEWALLDGLAVELELPLVGTELHAVKAAVQWTAPSPSSRLQHGVQLIGERLLHEHGTEGTALYIAGGRAGRLGLLAMMGARVSSLPEVGPVLLANPSAFVELGHGRAIGIEGNVAVADGVSGAALAQVHWQVARHLRVQLGGGATFDVGRTGALALARWIVD